METREEALRRGINETLDSIVSPAVRDTLLRDALAAAGLSDVPLESASYQQFLDGALRRILERALGRELGRSVVEELERLNESPDIDPESSAALAAARARAARSPAVLEGRGSSPAERPTRSDIPSAGSRRFTLPAGSTPESDAPPSARSAHLAAPAGPMTAEPPPAAALPAGAAGTPTVAAMPASTATPAGTPATGERGSRAPTLPAHPAIRWSEPRPPASGDFPSGTADALGMQNESSAPPSRRLPMVFIATRDPELVRRFAAWLDPRAVVVRVSRLIDLLLDLEDVGTRRTVIVFDSKRPPWRPEALSAVAEELPEECRVLLWGAAREVHADLCRISPRVARWMACPETMPLPDVVERCATLVG